MPAINVKDYGLQYLFPYQRLVTDNILRNEEMSMQGKGGKEEGEEGEEGDWRKNQIIILPTAAGKSLCFQLPAPLLSGVTVVVYPLLGLIADQGRRLQSLGITNGTLTGSVSKEERAKVLEAVAAGHVRVILTNPETLLLPAIRERLKKIACSHLVIDEAHCISEWGRTFRPTYRDLGVLTREIQWNSISAFTATASEEIIADIRSTLFHDESVHLIRGNPDRENIHYSASPTLSVENEIIDTVIDGSFPTPLIIFCATRGEAVRYAQLLRHYTARRDVLFYHAGLSREEKTAVEKKFFESAHGILCATCAYGMGMDKGNIRTVLHTFLPATIESYLQESGRGGRDGKQAWAHLFYSPANLQRVLEYNPHTPLLSYAMNNAECRRVLLLRALGIEHPPCNGCDVCDGKWEKSHATYSPEQEQQNIHLTEQWQNGLSEKERFILRYLRKHQRAIPLEEIARKACFIHKGKFRDYRHALRYIYHLKEEGVINMRKGNILWGGGYRVRTSMFK